MTRLTGNESGATTAWRINARSSLPNGPFIESLRKARGWTREEFEYQTHLAVERIVAAGTADARFSYRYKRKKARGSFVGLGTTTLANIASGKRAYGSTFKILAETLEVSVQSLIHPADPSHENAWLESLPSSVDIQFDDVIGSTSDKRQAITRHELDLLFRTLLDRLFPPQDGPDDVG